MGFRRIFIITCQYRVDAENEAWTYKAYGEKLQEVQPLYTNPTNPYTRKLAIQTTRSKLNILEPL